MPTLDELVEQLGTGTGPIASPALAVSGRGAGAQPPPLSPATPSNLSKLSNKWAEFSPFADRFSPDVVAALVDYDAERVARGSQPLTREQTVKAAVAARDRVQVTPEAERSVSPLAIPGNALRDLGLIVASLPRLPAAAVSEVRQLPEIPQQIAAAQREGASPISAIAQAPGVRLLPGAFVLENIGSPGELVRHPLFTVLDVLPAAKSAAGATRVGRLGREAAVATGRSPNPLRDVLTSRVGEAGTLERSRLGQAVDVVMRETRPGQLLSATFGRDARDVSRLFEEEGARITAVMNGTIEPRDAFESMLRDSAKLADRHSLSPEDVGRATVAAQVGDYRELTGAQLAFLDDARQLTEQQGRRLVDLDELGDLEIDGRVEFFPRKQAAELRRARDLAAFTDRMARVRGEVLDPSGRLTLDDFDAGLEQAVELFRTDRKWGSDQARAILYALDGYGFDSSPLRGAMRAGDPADALAQFRSRRAAGQYDSPASRMSSSEIIAELRRVRHDTMADRLATAIRDQNPTRITRSLESLMRRTKFRMPVVDEPGFAASVRSLRDRARFDNTLLHKYTPRRAERMAERADRMVSRTPPARFEPLVAARARQQFTDRVMPSGASPEQAAEITRTVLEARWPRVAELTGRELDEIGQLREQVIGEVSSTWRDLQAAGHDPVFVHRVSRQRARQLIHPRVGPVPQTLTQARERFLDWGEPDGDLTVSLTHQAAEILGRRASEDAIDHIVRQYGVSESDLRERFADPAREITDRTGRGFEQSLRDVMSRQFEVFNPDQRGYSWGGSKLDQFRQENWWIPKPLADNLHRIAAPKGPISTAFDPVTKTFRYAVIGLSPRTHLYNILGGAAMLFGQSGVRGFANLRRAYELTRNPAGISDETVRATLGSQARHFTDAEFARADASTRLGRTMHRLLNETPNGRTIERASQQGRRLVDKSLELNGMFDDMYRVAAYLTGHDKAVTKGMSREAAEAAGREMMRKTMMDWTGLTPIERGIFKSVFPFYGFMSHALRYVSRYPVDHPLRAEVVASFGRAESEDLGALPQSFLSALFVGDPDSNRNALQLRGVNPFSDVSNLFTVAGFLSATNPAITTALEQVGVLRGEAELYPTLRYDPSTGRLAAVQQNPLLATIENVVPQTAIATSLLGLNAEFNERLRNDPAGARRSLASAAGLPVVWRNYNVTAEVAKAEIARQRSQDLAKQAALESGDWSEALRYPGLRDYYTALTQLPPEVLEAFAPQTREQVVDQVSILLAPQMAPSGGRGGGL